MQVLLEEAPCGLLRLKMLLLLSRPSLLVILQLASPDMLLLLVPTTSWAAAATALG